MQAVKPWPSDDEPPDTLSFLSSYTADMEAVKTWSLDDSGPPVISSWPSDEVDSALATRPPDDYGLGTVTWPSFSTSSSYNSSYDEQPGLSSPQQRAALHQQQRQGQQSAAIVDPPSPQIMGSEIEMADSDPSPVVEPVHVSSSAPVPDSSVVGTASPSPSGCKNCFKSCGRGVCKELRVACCGSAFRRVPESSSCGRYRSSCDQSSGQ